MISSRRGNWIVCILPCFNEIPVFNANSVDPDPILFALLKFKFLIH